MKLKALIKKVTGYDALTTGSVSIDAINVVLGESGESLPNLMRKAKDNSTGLKLTASQEQERADALALQASLKREDAERIDNALDEIELASGK